MTWKSITHVTTKASKTSPSHQKWIHLNMFLYTLYARRSWMLQVVSIHQKFCLAVYENMSRYNNNVFLWCAKYALSKICHMNAHSVKKPIIEPNIYMLVDTYCICKVYYIEWLILLISKHNTPLILCIHASMLLEDGNAFICGWMKDMQKSFTKVVSYSMLLHKYLILCIIFICIFISNKHHNMHKLKFYFLNKFLGSGTFTFCSII